MVTAKILLHSVVLIDLEFAVGVILEQDPICVGWALLILIQEDVLVLTTLVSGPKENLRLDIAWEHISLGHHLIQLIQLFHILRCLLNIWREL